jgi:hypothetical protein
MTSSDPLTQRIEALITLTGQLTDVIARQAACFEAHRPHDAAPLVAEMSPLANLYRHETARIREIPGLLDRIAPDLYKALATATEAFDAVLARQARAIEAAKEITEGLVRAIAEEVASQRGAKSATYGPASAPATSANVTAITLNKRA